MNYMKGYNNRERRRRRRSRFSKGSDNYIGNSSYSSRSKYRSSMGQAVSGRWIVCLIAVIVLIAVSFMKDAKKYMENLEKSAKEKREK